MTLRTITFEDSTHKIVPLEPTIDMTIKGNESKDNWNNDFPTDFEEWSGCKQAHYLANLCYKAMIAAAPEYQDIAQSVVEENGKLRQRLANKSAWIKLLKANQDTKKD